MTEDCSLCGLPAYESDRLESDGEVYCCRGCMLVDEQVEGVEQQTGEPTGGEAVEDGETSFFRVDGMHCTTCEIYLESAASDREEVLDASASYAGGAMKVVHDEEVSGDELAASLSGRGYTVSPAEDAPRQEDGTVGRLVVGVVLGMMVMTWYALFLYPRYFGYPPVVDLGYFDGLYLGFNLAVMSGVVLFYTGWPVLRGASVSLETRQPNTDLLVATAASAAYLYSVFAVALGGTDLYFDVTVAVVLAVTLGEHYKSRAQRKARETLERTSSLRSSTARLADGSTVPVDDLEGGERIEVSPGERVPVDGRIVSGDVEVDESLVTGEELPVKRSRGDLVHGGSSIVGGKAELRVRDDAPSAVDRVVEQLWHEGSETSGVQKTADRLATVFVPMVAAVALLAVALQMTFGAQPAEALMTGLVVTVVACPCALGIASPLAKAVGTARALEEGVAVSGESVFETTGGFDHVVFDKTGTLTESRLDVRWAEGSEEALDRAAAVESLSSHPVARAVARYRDRLSADGGAAAASDHESLRRGASAEVDGDEVVVGDRSELEDRGWTVGYEPVDAADVVEVLVGWDGEARGRFAVGGLPREGWKQAVSWFRGRGATVYLATGDEGGTVERFRGSAEFDEVVEGVPPEAKAALVRDLASRGRTLMVGDGVNDAPALAAADVGVAVGDESLSVDAADVSVEGGPSDVVEAVELVEATARRMRQNVAWAFTYNAVALPLAAAGMINPLLAAAAMTSSSLLVVANSTRS